MGRADRPTQPTGISPLTVQDASQSGSEGAGRHCPCRLLSLPDGGTCGKELSTQEASGAVTKIVLAVC